MSVDEDKNIGQQFGNYRLVHRLGSGGFASVYLGQHMLIATQHVAVKILHLFDVNTQNFQQEAETTAALVHPHIVRLFDFAATCLQACQPLWNYTTGNVINASPTVADGMLYISSDDGKLYAFGLAA